MTTNTVRVQMMEPVRFYTRDAAPRSRDAILSPPSREELAANQRRTASMSGLDLGVRWTGDLKPVGEAVARVIDALSRVKDEALQKQGLSSAVVALANYGNAFATSEAGRGPSGSLAFGGNLDEMRGGREEDLSGHAMVEDIQKSNDKFWADRGRSRAQDGAGGALSTRATAESINASNAAFWSGQPTHRYGGQWGKG